MDVQVSRPGFTRLMNSLTLLRSYLDNTSLEGQLLLDLYQLLLDLEQLFLLNLGLINNIGS